MNVETFVQGLQALQARGDRLQRRTGEAVEGEALLTGLVGSRPTGPPTPTAVPGAAADRDNLTVALQRVVHTAVPLLRADGAGLMLADQDGDLHVVTSTDRAGETFERAQRDLGEGPCIDAFASTEVVRTNDLWTDPRWPRLGPAARINRIRSVLSAPIIKDGRAVGTCNALTTSPRTWTDINVDAIRAYAALLAQLIGSVSDARHKGELAAQLQSALDSQVLIEQAKGMLMERHGLDEQAAFARLRRWARSSSRRVTEVACEVIADRNQCSAAGDRSTNRRGRTFDPRIRAPASEIGSRQAAMGSSDPAG